MPVIVLVVSILTFGLSLAAPGGLVARDRPESGYGCAAPEARQFDFWIGDWNVVNRNLQEDGSWKITGTATDRVYSILDGCAVVEHWQGRAFDGKMIGFSVRAYDPETGLWTLVLSWPAKDRPGIGTLEGEFRHGRGEFFVESTSQAGERVLHRYSFSDTREKTFRWDSATSMDQGRSWSTGWIMEMTRREPDELPLFNGPRLAHGRERHCGGVEEASQLDYLEGTWQGTEQRHEDDGSWTETQVRLTTLPILEGCAQMDFYEHTAAGAHYKRFAVRTWMTGRQRWGQYELDNTDPKFRFTQGHREEGSVVLISSDDGETLHRVAFFEIEGGVRREDSRSMDNGVTWRRMTVLELAPTL